MNIADAKEYHVYHSYRNQLEQHEYDLINGEINVETYREWQDLYMELLKFKEKRIEFQQNDKKGMLNKYLKDQDNYLDIVLNAMEREMTLIKDNKFPLTDNLIAKSFYDVKIIATYNNMRRKLEFYSSKRDKTAYFDDEYRKALAMHEYISKEYRDITDTLGFNKVKKEENEEDIKFDYVYYLSLKLEDKKNYLEELIEKISKASSRWKIDCLYLGDIKAIPLKYKALFFELISHLKSVKKQIKKDEAKDIYLDFNSNYYSDVEHIKLDTVELPIVDVSGLSHDELTKEEIDTTMRINKLRDNCVGKDKYDLVMYQDHLNNYLVCYDDSIKLLELYARKKAIDKIKGKDTLEYAFNALKERKAFLKSYQDDLIDNLGNLLQETKEKEDELRSERIKNLLNCAKDLKGAFAQILSNLDGFIHIKSIGQKEKQATLTQSLEFVTDSDLTDEIKENLEFLETNDKTVTRIENKKKSRNPNRLFKMLNGNFDEQNLDIDDIISIADSAKGDISLYEKVLARVNKEEINNLGRA